MKSVRWSRTSAVSTLWVLAMGCSAGTHETSLQSVDSGGQTPVPDAAGCVAESCTCAGVPGIRSCDVAGVLGSCQCLPPAMASDAAVVVYADPCPTGTYTGNFDGAAGFVIATTPVSGLELFDDTPPLEIMLRHASGASEFEVVGSGVMRGNADGTFPFQATIMGKLDCNTKKFTATLVGSVQIVLDGIDNDFTGTMESTYDTDNHSFTDGKWTVTGSDADGGTDFGLTGDGTWKAMHADDTDAGSGDGGAGDGG